MYNVLDFIDSPDIREYNKDREFTPSQQAILVAWSEKKTVEEKIDMMHYLLERYRREEWEMETLNNYDGTVWSDVPETFWEVAHSTVCQWEETLKARENEEGVIYAAMLNECDFYYEKNERRYRFFSNYNLAYQYLVAKKKEYLDDEDPQETRTYGVICQIVLDSLDGNDSNKYWFDNELRLVDVDAGSKIDRKYPYNAHESSFYLPIPFQKGDIVKVYSPFWGAFYAVVPYEGPKRTPDISMYMTVDAYEEGGDFFYDTDRETPVLHLYRCEDKELPEGQEMLKELRNVRKGELDWMELLIKYSQKNKVW